MRGLNWTIDRNGDTTKVLFAGSIDETANFGELLPELQQSRTIHLDVGGVRRINSSGVREWIHFVRAIPAASGIALEKCTPALVSQLNVINKFAGAAQVVSVFAPFTCVRCGAHEAVLLDVTAGRKALPLPSVRCPRCQEPMEFDDIEESYFAFLDAAAVRP